MKYLYIFFFYLIFNVLFFTSCKKEEKKEVFTGTWKSISPLPSQGRTFAIGFSLTGKGYVGGGKTGQNYGNAPAPDNLDDFWVYDANTDTWTEKNKIPFSYDNCLPSSVKNKGYVLTYSSMLTKVDNLWEYDPDFDIWSLRKEPPVKQFSLGGSSFFASFTINGKIYYYFDKDAFYAYDPLIDTWSLKAPFPGDSRRYPNGLAIGPYGYVGFGFALNSADRFRDFYRYDPSTDEWMRVADYPQEGRQPNIAFSNQEYGFVMEYGGSSISNGPCFIFQYNPSSNIWERKTNFERNIRHMAVFTIDNHTFVGTGEALEPAFTEGTTFANGTNEFWEFIP